MPPSHSLLPCPTLPAHNPTDANRACSGEGGRGRGRRLLNRGMNSGNYIVRRDDGGGSAAAEAVGPAAKEDDHAHEAALGFPLHTDGPDRLGWLMNMNQVSCPGADALKWRCGAMAGQPAEARCSAGPRLGHWSALAGSHMA